jgi:hypothetical protein
MKLRSSLLTIAAGLTFAASALAQPDFAEPRERWIKVTGMAAGIDQTAAEQAKQDALRLAVERACGVFINAQSQVADFELVRDKILQQAVGYIKEYKVLDEHNDGSLSYCTVDALVSTQRFEQDWAALAQTREQEANPRCVMVVIEDDNVDDLKSPRANGIVQSCLENFFLNHDIQLMDKGQSEAVRQRDLALAAINDDIDRLAAVGAQLKAEVVLVGNAEAKYAGDVTIAGYRKAKWDCSLTIRIIQTDSAMLLASNVYRPEKTFFTDTGAAGASEGLEQIAREQAAQILQDLGEAWRKRVNVRRILRVTLEPANRADFKVFQTHLAQVKGVQGGDDGVKLRELVNDVADVEVDWSYDLNTLADRIEQLTPPGVRYEVVEQTADRLRVRLNTE